MSYRVECDHVSVTDKTGPEVIAPGVGVGQFGEPVAQVADLVHLIW